MNIFKTYGFMLMAGVALVGAASCSDPDAELTSVEYARLFTPTDVTMKVVDQTSILVEFNCISHPEAFEIEFYEGETVSGAPARTITLMGTNRKAVSFTSEGFRGKTTYIARVRAKNPDKESGWGVSDKFVTTKEEQILLDSKVGDVTETSLKIRWNPAMEVSHIVYVCGPTDTFDEMTESRTITDSEKLEGALTLTELFPGTDYKVTIYNGEDARGKMTYTTAGAAPKPVVIEGKFIEYVAAAAVPADGRIALSGTTVMANAKIHENKDGVDAIQLKNGYTSEDVLNANVINLTVEGGFKKGDKITIAGFFNNADDTKKSAVDIITTDASAAGYKVLFTTKPFINGRTSTLEPVDETFVLEEDAPVLMLGRNGNTGTNVCKIIVERGAAGGDEPVIAPDPFAAEGILLTFAEKSTTYSVNGLTLTIDNTDDKLAVDDNTAFFGAGPATCQKFTKRLKTGTKSGAGNAKNFMTIEVPSNGTLYFCARTGSNGATDRNIVVAAGEKELVNKILLEAEALQDQTIEGEANPQKIYAPVTVDVEKGTYTISYPVGAINFYAIKFIAK